MSIVPTFSRSASVSISDGSKRIVLTSEGHLALLGRTRDQVVGRSWQEWMTGDEFQAASVKFKRLLTRHVPYDLVTHIVHADGRLVPVVVHCSTIHGQTPADDLVLCQTRTLEESVMQEALGAFACATSVRDIAYELAAYTGRYRMPDVTQSLIAASASAEHAIEALSHGAPDKRS